jgi:hypothetical protein
LDVNLESLVRPTEDAGVPGGAELLEFAEALIGTDAARLAAAREALAAGLSPETVTAAAAVAGNFSKNDRIANALGIPVDPNDLAPTREIRALLGLDDFRSAANTFRHFPNS